MSKRGKRVFLLTCILSLQLIKPAMSLYANEMRLTYDGKQHIYNKAPITLEIDNKKIETPMPPLQIDERTLVPGRGVFEAMGASVEWKSAEKKVFINHGETLIILEVDNQDAWVDGESKKLDVPPKLINGNLMLPLRFIGETLGYQVDWDDNTRNIRINQGVSVPGTKPPVIKPSEFKTKVEEVKVSNQANGSSLYTIHLESPLDSYSNFTQEGKVVVDIDSAKNALASSIILPDNPYVDKVRTSQYKADTTRVVFDLKQDAKSTVTLSADKKTIKINMEATKSDVSKPDVPKPDVPKSEASEKGNIRYTNTPREAIIFKKAPGVSVDDIKIEDDYRNNKIIVTLPGNYSQVHNDTTLMIGSSTLDKVTIQSSSKTQFVIHEKKIRAYDIIDEGDNIKIIFMDSREKYEKIILLDMGHGAHDGGASANGLVEKKLNLEQGMIVFNLLESDPTIKVYMTREDDSYPTNSSRAKMANEIGVDIFVSLHHNSYTTPTPNGTEILYSTKDPRSKQMAQILQKNMISRLGTYDRKIKPRTDLLIFNASKVPTVLVETAFVTNPEDAQKLKSPEFNKKAAQAIYDSIVEIFNKISFR